MGGGGEVLSRCIVSGATVSYASELCCLCHHATESHYLLAAQMRSEKVVGLMHSNSRQTALAFSFVQRTVQKPGLRATLQF